MARKVRIRVQECARRSCNDVGDLQAHFSVRFSGFVQTNEMPVNFFPDLGHAVDKPLQRRSYRPVLPWLTCPSRIRCQAATGSWTKSRQWETQRTLFSSARATMCPPTKVDGVWPFNDAWLRTSLS